MNILVVSSKDPRQRHVFISDPLVDLGHEVHICRSNLQLAKYIVSVNRKIDIILCIGLGSSAIIALQFKYLLNAKYVVRVGGDTVGDIKSQIVGRRENNLPTSFEKIRLVFVKFVLCRTEEMIVVSESITKKLKPYISNKCNVSVIPQHVKGNRLPVVATRHITNRLQILTVTNFLFREKSQGVISILDALESLVMADKNRSLPPITFKVAGGGIELQNVNRRAKEIKCGDRLNIEILGFVTDVQSLYKNADLFVYSSERDAVPNVLLEARRHSLLCVLFRCSLGDDVFQPGADGMYADSHADLSRIISSLVSEKNLIDDLKLQSLERLWENYSHDAIRVKMQSWIASKVNF